MKKPTQCERIVQYIEQFGSITPAEAINDLGCYRLASRICDLKRRGYPIHTEMITVKNRMGERCRVARYSLCE